MKAIRSARIAGLAGLLVACVTLACEAFAFSASVMNKTERAFHAWVSEKAWPAAKAKGVSRRTFEAAFAGVTLDWTLPELQPPGTGGGAQPEGQAEFRSPAAYFDEGRLKALVAGGRQAMQKWRSTLAAVEKRYGVPAAILVSVWGRESAFGRAAPDRNAIRALATEAFIGRRKETFFPELIAALQILQRGDIAPGAMTSSWAGALGQTQFLPSQVLAYAVDFDGDGKDDIWDSVPDTLASIANYLVAYGWKRGIGWGFEVRVPPGVSCALEGPEQGKPVAAWQKLGVAPVAGKFPADAKPGRSAFLLMPAGRLGPAWLVSENFYVLKDYNYSDLYALFIGHLADRFTADKSFAGKWAKVAGGYTRRDMQTMQKRLVGRGYDVGNVDGLIGFKTRIAIGLWQAKKGMAETCFPDGELLASLR